MTMYVHVCVLYTYTYAKFRVHVRRLRMRTVLLARLWRQSQSKEVCVGGRAGNNERFRCLQHHQLLNAHDGNAQDSRHVHAGKRHVHAGEVHAYCATVVGSCAGW